ncbi:hypothetical protein Tco_1371720 [Tanacetum coccineum]
MIMIIMGDWHDPSDVPSSGMVPRATDSTCSDYDYYPYFGWISFMPVQADNVAEKGAVVERERPRAKQAGNGAGKGAVVERERPQATCNLCV